MRDIHADSDLAVLVPVFNNQEGLDKTVASLRHCDAATPFTLVIVDDGSTTPITLPQDYPYPVERLRLNRNVGITSALNEGLHLIMARPFKYVARIDAGDTCSADRLYRQVEFLETHQDYGLVGTHAMATDMLGAPLYPITPPTCEKVLCRAMHLNNMFLHPTVMMRVDALRKAGIYSENYPAAEDYELFFRLMQSSRAGIIGEPLVNIEINPGGITLTKKRKQVITRIRIQLEYFEWRHIESYTGLLRSSIALLSPPAFGVWRRKIFARVPV